MMHYLKRSNIFRSSCQYCYYIFALFPNRLLSCRTFIPYNFYALLLGLVFFDFILHRTESVQWSETLAHGFYAEIHVSTYAAGGQLTPTPEDIPEPSHGRVFREKLHSVYVVKGV